MNMFQEFEPELSVMLTQTLSPELPLLAQFPSGINGLLVSGLYLILVLRCVHVAPPWILLPCRIFQVFKLILNFAQWLIYVFKGAAFTFIT